MELKCYKQFLGLVESNNFVLGVFVVKVDLNQKENKTKMALFEPKMTYCQLDS